MKLWACLNVGFIRATVVCGYRHSLLDDACFSEVFNSLLFLWLTKQTPTKTFVGPRYIYKLFVLLPGDCEEVTKGVDCVSLSMSFFLSLL